MALSEGRTLVAALFFGNPAIRAHRPHPWLCVPASRLVCLFRKSRPPMWQAPRQSPIWLILLSF